MGDDDVGTGKSLRHKVVVGDLEEGVDRRWLVAATGSPLAHDSERGKCGSVGTKEEAGAAQSGPGGEIVSKSENFVADFLDTEDAARSVLFDEPVPEAGTEIEAIVEISGCDENVGVEKVGHQKLIPRVRDSARKVDIFLNPSKRKASEKEDLPSNVLETTARENRFPTRAPSVK